MVKDIILMGGILIGLLLLTSGLILISATFHEGSHWLMGRIWTENMRIESIRGIIPRSVVYDDIGELPRYGIRLAGGAPALFGIPIGLVIYLSLSEFYYAKILLSLPFLAGSILSPSDLLALIYPARFAKFAEDNDSAGHVEMVRILYNQVKK